MTNKLVRQTAWRKFCVHYWPLFLIYFLILLVPSLKNAIVMHLDMFMMSLSWKNDSIVGIISTLSGSETYHSLRTTISVLFSVLWTFLQVGFLRVCLGAAEDDLSAADLFVCFRGIKRIGKGLLIAVVAQLTVFLQLAVTSAVMQYAQGAAVSAFNRADVLINAGRAVTVINLVFPLIVWLILYPLLNVITFSVIDREEEGLISAVRCSWGVFRRNWRKILVFFITSILPLHAVLSLIVSIVTNGLQTQMLVSLAIPDHLYGAVYMAVQALCGLISCLIVPYLYTAVAVFMKNLFQRPETEVVEPEQLK